MALFSLIGKDQLINALDAWAHDVSDLRTPFTQIGLRVIAPAIAKKFSAAGPGWAPLSESYGAWKAIHYPGAGLLVRTRAMRQMLTGQNVAVATENSLTVQPKGAAAYWKFHQQGTRRMPARPMLPSANEVVQGATSTLTQAITQFGRNHGFRVAP